MTTHNLCSPCTPQYPRTNSPDSCLISIHCFNYYYLKRIRFKKPQLTLGDYLVSFRNLIGDNCYEKIDTVHSYGLVKRDDSQRRLLAQHSVTTLLRHCFEWLQYCSSIATLCCAKNRRCESSRVRSPLKG